MTYENNWKFTKGEVINPNGDRGCRFCLGEPVHELENIETVQQQWREHQLHNINH